MSVNLVTRWDATMMVSVRRTVPCRIRSDATASVFSSMTNPFSSDVVD